MQTVEADRVIGQIVRRLKEQGMYVRKGANRLELFLVDTSSGRTRLRPLTISV